MNGYELFLNQIDEVIATYPKLKRVESEGRFIIKGEIDIIDTFDKYWTSYQIEIWCSSGFPTRFPILYETGGKIPKIGDWHIYEDSKACCLKVPPEEIISCKNGINILQFLDAEVIPYLFNQTHRIEVGYYANGEYSHGAKGIYEFYSTVLDTAGDVASTIRLMKLIATKPEPSRTSMCFCKSAYKYRKCHRRAYRILSQIGSADFISHIAHLDKNKEYLS